MRRRWISAMLVIAYMDPVLLSAQQNPSQHPARGSFILQQMQVIPEQ